MIKYKFKVEEPFTDKYTNKDIIKDAILEVTEERLQELNAAEVGRVISAEYVEDKDVKTPAKTTKGKNNNKTKEPETKEPETKEPEAKEPEAKEPEAENKEDK